MTRVLSMVIFTLATLLSGCSTTSSVAISEEAERELAGQSVKSQTLPSPGFVGSTAANASFGLIGAIAAASNGEALIKDNDVPDPALGIARLLEEDMLERYGMSTSESPRYSIDVKTTRWGFIYLATDWNNYQVLYDSKITLLDNYKNTAVASSKCAYKTPFENTNDAPSYHDLVQNKAAGLKEELIKATAHCALVFLDGSLPSS